MLLVSAVASATGNGQVGSKRGRDEVDAEGQADQEPGGEPGEAFDEQI